MITSFGDKVYARHAQQTIADAVLSALDQIGGPDADGVAVEDTLIDLLLHAAVAIRLHERPNHHPNDYTHHSEQLSRIIAHNCDPKAKPPKIFSKMARQINRRITGV